MNPPVRHAGRLLVDQLCLHGADVRDYRSPDFDVARAVAGNLAGIDTLCAAARASGTRRLLFTGSVGEPGEGGGSEPERAMSPYGLSKGLTWQGVAAAPACKDGSWRRSTRSMSFSRLI